MLIQSVCRGCTRNEFNSQILRKSIKEEVASTASGKVLEEKINETR